MTARLNDRYASRVFHFAKVGGGKGGGQEKKGGNSLKAGVRMQRDWRKPKVWYSSCRTHLP